MKLGLSSNPRHLPLDLATAHPRPQQHASPLRVDNRCYKLRLPLQLQPQSAPSCWNMATATAQRPHDPAGATQFCCNEGVVQLQTTGGPRQAGALFALFAPRLMPDTDLWVVDQHHRPSACSYRSQAAAVVLRAGPVKGTLAAALMGCIHR